MRSVSQIHLQYVLSGGGRTLFRLSVVLCFVYHLWVLVLQLTS